MWTFVSLLMHQVLALILPALVLTALLHLTERARSRIATWRWGFRAVLVTAWLGAPLHELSHAAVHKLFGHDLRKVVLFEPDAETGCLGYVEYAYDPKSLVQRVGRFFAGIAPLLGGTLVLGLLGWALLDDAGRWFPTGASARALASADGPIDALVAFARVTRNTLGALTALDNLGSPWFWVFLYFSACVVSHMAPSRADLSDPAPGAGALLALLVLADLVAAATGSSFREVTRSSVAFAAPIVGLLGFALSLSLIVLGITAAAALVSVMVRDRAPPSTADPDVRRAALSLGAVLASLLVLVLVAPRRRSRRRR